MSNEQSEGTPGTASPRSPFHLLAALALLGPATGACASMEGDVHLAPLYASISTPGGGRRLEALGGLLVRHTPPPGAEGSTNTSRIGLRPLWSTSVDEDGVKRIHVIPPLGRTTISEDAATSRFAPLYYWQRRTVRGPGAAPGRARDRT